MVEPTPVCDCDGGHVESGYAHRPDCAQERAEPAPLPWRVGSHYGIHVYEGDRPVATFHRAEDAAEVVRLREALSQLQAERDDALSEREALIDLLTWWARLSYWLRPYDPKRDARCLRWRRRPCPMPVYVAEDA